MRSRSVVIALVVCLAAGLGAGKKAGKGDKADQPLPDAVQATVTAHFPQEPVTGYEHQVDEGRQLYFVDVSTDGGKTVTMMASGRGQYLGQMIDNDDDSDLFIDLATAPDAVKQGIVKYFNVPDVSKVDLDNLFMEVEQSRFMFVAEQTKDNVGKWVTFTLTGVVVSVETEMALKDLPAAVKEGIGKANPGAKIDSANIVDDKEKKKTYYAVDILNGATKLTLTVTPEGVVESSEPADDDATTQQ